MTVLFVTLASFLIPAARPLRCAENAYVLAVVGLDGHEDAVVLVGVVATRERHRAASEGGKDDIP